MKKIVCLFLLSSLFVNNAFALNLGICKVSISKKAWNRTAAVAVGVALCATGVGGVAAAGAYAATCAGAAVAVGTVAGAGAVGGAVVGAREAYCIQRDRERAQEAAENARKELQRARDRAERDRQELEREKEKYKNSLPKKETNSYYNSNSFDPNADYSSLAKKLLNMRDEFYTSFSGGDKRIEICALVSLQHYMDSCSERRYGDIFTRLSNTSREIDQKINAYSSKSENVRNFVSNIKDSLSELYPDSILDEDIESFLDRACSPERINENVVKDNYEGIPIRCCVKPSFRF